MRKHGEFVAPEIGLTPDAGPQPENPHATTGIIQRFGKGSRASSTPSALGIVAAVYRDAIQFVEASASPQMRGLGLMAVLGYVGIASFLVPEIFRHNIERFQEGSLDLYTVAFSLFILFFLFVIARPWIVAAWHLDMFSADDQPTIFDRKRRKVYRLFTPLDGSTRGWRQRFKPIKLEAVEYDWDCITAEHRAEMVTTGKTVTRIHRLTMVVRDRRREGEKYGRLLEEFNVGNSMALGPNSVPMLWEHIRRFMEERGPAVPEDEPLQVFERPKNLWQSLGVVGPLGPRFGWWWRTNPVAVAFTLIALPFMLPFSLLWGTCNWISHMTMRKTIWPEEVRQLLGSPVRTA